MEQFEWSVWIGVLLCILNVVLAMALLRRARNREQAQMAPSNLDGYLTVMGYDEDTGFPEFRLTISRDPREVAEKELARFRLGTPPAPVN